MIFENRRGAAIASVLFLLLTASCAPLGGGQAPASSFQKLTKTPEMERSFQQAEKAYAARKLDEAQNAYESYLSAYPYNALTPKAYFRLGEISFSKKDYGQAEDSYGRSLQKGVHPDWGAYAIYKLALSYSYQDNPRMVFRTLDRLPVENTDRKSALRAASLRVQTAKKAEDLVQEKRGYLEVLDAYEGLTDAESKVGDLNWAVGEKTALDEVRSWVKEENPESTEKLKNLWKRSEGKRSGAYLSWALARLYDQAGDYKSSVEWSRRYLQVYPKGEYASQIKRRLAELDKREGVVPAAAENDGEGRNAIGVLLPLTGKYALYGESVLHGIECGAGVFGPCRGDLNLNLLVRDTQGDPVLAAKLVRELASDAKVRLIIGPLPQVEVDQATQAAEQAQIPMISLSQKEDVASRGNYIFRNFLTVRDQVASLVSYSCQQKRIKKYAILSPSGATGEEYKKAFEEELSRCGGKLVAQASYPPDARNLVEAVRSLKNSSDGAAGFQALFFPDVYRRVPEVVAALKNAGVDKMILMGGAGWDHPALLKTDADFLEGSFYVSPFFAKSERFPIRDFGAMFESAYGSEPTLLEAYAFDTVRLAGDALKGAAGTRTDLQKTLSEKKNFEGVTGSISFDEEGDARRRLPVMIVDQGGVREAK